MSPRSLPPDARARAFATAQKLSGPALAGLGLAGLAAIALLPAAKENPLARWLLAETLMPARVLPLIGLGAAFALVGGRVLGAAIVLFGAGIILGIAAEDQLLRILDVVPQAATHLFLVDPIAYLAAGAALACGDRLRPFFAPIGAVIFGAMLALAVKLNDPSLHEPAYTWLPVLIACWIVAAVVLTLRAFRRGWFSIFGRILGSWLVAIGLLYGGASLVPQRRAPPPMAAPAPPQNAAPPGFDREIPGLPGPDQPGPIPGGGNRFRQP
ncbi:MAG: hypothetical protein ACREB8_13935 [Pseudolabrys sp.]